ncbi:hypothetical protein [Streptococcus salivarius]|jgi:hypothetical protein|uniref:hypothetical protein n=1 Tax=Streptococcus salivarius TaxID=1304 RepID=UPI000CE20C2F|nr:hypothetical protein [Streptococcus salivarius]MEB3643768.1 hypothetical protein [Streptococcus salivarius]PPA33085.1 hypothetical protein CGZ74_06460 [Streptococcus salivarius]
MSSVYDKFVCPIIKFLIIAFLKLLFDIVVLTATGWEYTNFIFFEAFFASCCLCFKYIKQSKKQQEEAGLNTQFNFSFFKNTHYKLYKSRFIKFLKDNKVILLFLFLSNGNLLSIIENSNKEFFPMINKMDFKNENLVNCLLDFLRFLNNDQNLVNFLFSCYFCLIVWIFINQIDFQLFETVSSHKESGNDKK